MASIAKLLGGMSQEEKNEAAKKEDRKIQLLEIIAAKVGGESGGGSEEPAADGAAKGVGFKAFLGSLVGSLFTSLGSGLMAAAAIMFKPANLLKILTKAFPLAMLFGSLFNGVMEAFDTFKEGGSVGEVIASFLAGILEFLSFGLLDSEKIESALLDMFDLIDEYVIQPVEELFDNIGQFFSDMWDTISTFTTETIPATFDEYVIQPITNFFTDIGNIFSTVWQSVSDFVSSIPDLVNEHVIEPMGNLFDEYVVQPISNLFDKLKGFFNDMGEGVMNMLESIGFPEIVLLDNAITGKVAVGPWYPFRDESQAETAATGGGLGHTGGVESSESGDDGSLTKTYADGSYSISGAEGTVGYDAEGNEMYRQSISMNGYNRTTFADGSTMDRLDQGGLSTVIATDDEGNQVVEKSRYTAGDNTIEQTTVRGETTARYQDILRGIDMEIDTSQREEELAMDIKREEAYNQLNWWNKRKANVGWDPLALLEEQMQEEGTADMMTIHIGGRSTGTELNEASEEVNDGNRAASSAPITTVVAPTNVSNSSSTNLTPSIPPRGQDSSYSRMMNDIIVSP